jgi:hypothetical protein
MVEALILKDKNNFNQSFIANTLFNMNDPCENYCNWEVHITGKGTFPNKETFKKDGYLWNSQKKSWYKNVNKDFVPMKYIKKQKQEEKEYYNHLRKFKNIFSQKYCQNDDCFNKKDEGETHCPYCKYEMSLVGDLICQGWMSFDCKYNGRTMKGFSTCEGCDKDAMEWVEEGIRVCGPCGHFGNDNS